MYPVKTFKRHIETCVVAYNQDKDTGCTVEEALEESYNITKIGIRIRNEQDASVVFQKEIEASEDFILRLKKFSFGSGVWLGNGL